MLTFGLDFAFRRPADANPLDLNNFPAGEDHSSRDHGNQTHLLTLLHICTTLNIYIFPYLQGKTI